MALPVNLVRHARKPGTEFRWNRATPETGIAIIVGGTHMTSVHCQAHVRSSLLPSDRPMPDLFPIDRPVDGRPHFAWNLDSVSPLRSIRPNAVRTYNHSQASRLRENYSYEITLILLMEVLPSTCPSISSRNHGAHKDMELRLSPSNVRSLRSCTPSHRCNFLRSHIH